MTSDSPPHLIIEEGPEKGRELTIPPDGARIGRANENDISIADAAMSRFQCRMYFRDGFLHLMDLGSTNESLVNNETVSDVALRFGDEILVGESLLKVINDGLHEKTPQTAPAPAAEKNEPDAEPAPIIFNPEGEASGASEEPPPAAASSPKTENEVDLGLGRREELLEASEKSERSSNMPLLWFTLVVMLIVIGAGLFILSRTAPPPPETSPEDENLQVYYEKVIAEDGNIFRYALDLDSDGKMKANVHDLRQQRNLSREEDLGADRVNRLRKQLIGNKDSLMTLANDYEGLPVGSHESYRLTVIFGNEAKTIRVSNQLEPDVFRQVREQIEAFANNELALINVNIPPEQLRERASESWANAQKLYAQRDVKNQNLWEATQKLKDVIFLLETIEPKPEYYAEAVKLRQQWMKQLMDRLEQLEFEAVRAYKVGNISQAVDLNRRILKTYPDKSGNEYKQAYNRLTLIEQEMN